MVELKVVQMVDLMENLMALNSVVMMAARSTGMMGGWKADCLASSVVDYLVVRKVDWKADWKVQKWVEQLAEQKVVKTEQKWVDHLVD